MIESAFTVRAIRDTLAGATPAARAQLATVLGTAFTDADASYRPFAGRHDLDFTSGDCRDCDDDHGPSKQQEAHHLAVGYDHLQAALVEAYARIAELEREKGLALGRLAHLHNAS